MQRTGMEELVCFKRTELQTEEHGRGLFELPSRRENKVQKAGEAPR